MGTGWKLQSWPACALVLAAALVAGCASGSQTPAASGQRVEGGTATVAELPQSAPNYIFPFVSPAYDTIQNTGQFQALMYRPLYWLSSGSSLSVNEQLSLGLQPAWNAAHDQVRITLKKFKWSDGTPLTPQNVAFWVGLSRTEKANSANYTPGQFPDNVKSVSYDNQAGTVTFMLKASVSPDWFLYDQLADITPLPLAWDTTGGSSGPAGCSAENARVQAAACPKVYTYLNGRAKTTATYASDPLWQVVDGPFKLKAFSAGGDFTLVRNPSYSGSPKPNLDEVKFLPFTSETAEYNTLQSGGSLSVGYVPTDVLKAKASNATPGPSPLPGYTLDPVQPWGFSYILINFNNPTVGPVFRQLYLRQALQSVVDQNVDIDKAGSGYGAPAYGPVPLNPPSPFTRGMSAANPYPFSPAHARQLLAANGWTIPASGPASCGHPGTGPGQCGAGISQGQKLSLKLESYNGSPSTEEIMSQLASDASQAGIGLTVSSVAPQQMVADATQCKPNQPSCSWQLINYGSAILTPYPSGASLFQTGAGVNIGSYSSAKMDSLISATLTSSDPGALASYAAYAAQQVPVLWQPTMAGPVYDVANNLKGVTPVSPLYNLTPEMWYLTK